MLVDDAVDVHLVEDGLALRRLDPIHVYLLSIMRRQHQGLVNRNRSAESKISMGSTNFANNNFTVE